MHICTRKKVQKNRLKSGHKAVLNMIYGCVVARWADEMLLFFLVTAEYKTLCPGGEGFRPNPITVILEGQIQLTHS